MRTLCVVAALVIGAPLMSACGPPPTPEECIELNAPDRAAAESVWPDGIPIAGTEHGACDDSGDPLVLKSAALTQAEIDLAKAAMARDGWTFEEQVDALQTTFWSRVVDGQSFEADLDVSQPSPLFEIWIE